MTKAEHTATLNHFVSNSFYINYKQENKCSEKNCKAAGRFRLSCQTSGNVAEEVSQKHDVFPNKFLRNMTYFLKTELAVFPQKKV